MKSIPIDSRAAAIEFLFWLLISLHWLPCQNKILEGFEKRDDNKAAKNVNLKLIILSHASLIWN